MKRMIVAVLAVLAMPMAWAQDEMPAVGAQPERMEAPTATSRSAGTTIVGERESPIGLYITPWRESRAEDNVDRPARLLQEKMQPIDETVFLRQIEYYNALSGALKQKGKVTP